MRKRFEKRLEAEMQFHLDAATQAYIADGLQPEEARRRALVDFGVLELAKDEMRDLHPFHWVNEIGRDLRYAIRQLRKSPAFTVAAILTLALGIGANTAIFSVVKAVLLSPLPYREPGRLVTVWEQNLRRGWHHNIVSAANFLDWREHNHVFTDMAALQLRAFALTGNGDPVEVNAEQITPNLFSVLGVEPLYGRAFLLEEGRPNSARVVIVGYGLWRSRYGSDPKLIGKQILLDDQSYTVIGIMPASFRDAYVADGLLNAQIWIAGLDLSNPHRDWHDYFAIARLKPRVTVQQAQNEMDVMSDRIQRQYPEDKGWTTLVIGLHNDLVAQTRPALVDLMLAVALVLLIACVNLANLLLARGAGRIREMALRSALGASRRRLIRQLLTESCLLSLFGAGLGLLFAAAATKTLVSLAPAGTFGIESAGLNIPVLGYTLVIAVIAGLLFGMLPALGLSRPDVNGALKESSRSSSEGSRAQALRKILVSAEFALSLVLVIGAVLMIKTIVFLREINPGFNPHHVVTMTMYLDSPRYKPPGSRVEFWNKLLPRVQFLPGVQYASVSRGVPFEGWSGNDFVTAENPHPAMSEIPAGNAIMVGPQYFRAMGVPLLEGRAFTDADTEGNLPTAIVNEELVRENWPGQNPIGKRLKMYSETDEFPWLTVVGVAGNVRTQGPDVGFHPEIYMPYMQYSSWQQHPFDLVIRTFGQPLSVVPAVRRAVAELDKNLPISETHTMDEMANGTLSFRNFVAMLLGSFAGLALVLAAVGIYGVIAYSVAQRTQEIGVRMALGAEEGNILRGVIRQGLTLAAIGTIIGLAAAFALTRFLSEQLYGVGATDPFTFAIVPALLLCVAFLACYTPARRAARVDPIVALRYE